MRTSKPAERKEPERTARIKERLIKAMDDIGGSMPGNLSGAAVINECLEQILEAANRPKDDRYLEVFDWIDKSKTKATPTKLFSGLHSK